MISVSSVLEYHTRNNMSVKMMVTDMDGTFYHKDLTYDRERFRRLFQMMREQGIHFVVASGNQYYQLISFFEDLRDEITVVAENGGYIVDCDKEMFSVSIKRETYEGIVRVLRKYPKMLTIVCGKRSAYISDQESEERFNEFKLYYPVMERVADFMDVDDQILKFALMADEESMDAIVKELEEAVDEDISVVTSGFYCIDLIVKGVHKGNAIKMLMEKWKLKPEEVMAFGDARNDLEMLKMVKYGYLMENASDETMKQIISRRAPSLEEDGVLQVMERYLTDPKGFEKTEG